MINFTDVNPTLFASDGQFFYGKLVFLSPGTTDPKQVFDKDGVVYASNVVTTDTHGRMEIQVFLDGAYDVQFWKFVGTQFDIDDTTQWAFDREMRVLDPTKVPLEISGDAIVGTIDDLRGVDNAAEGATMTVMGYYAAGDMTPQYYYWNPNVSDTDDGGSVICPEGRTGAGRWLMIPQRVVDVRAFGVKPSQQANTATVTGNMAGAFNFANRYNRDLWFPKVYSSAQYSQQVYSYYAFNGGSLQLPNNDLLIDNCVRFLNKVSSQTNFSVRNIEKNDRLFPDGAGGPFVVVSNTWRTVWGEVAVTFSPRNKLIIDDEAVVSDAWSISNVEVVLEYPNFGLNGIKNLSFTNCVFTIGKGVSGNGSLAKPSTITKHSFTNCVLTDRIYSDGGNYPLWKLMRHKITGTSDYNVSVVDCDIAPVGNFNDPMNFLISSAVNGSTDIDMCGRVLSIPAGTSLDVDPVNANRTIRNSGGSSFDWGDLFQGSLTFFSCRFNVAPYSGSNKTAVFHDCFFSDSNVGMTIGNCTMHDCDVGMPVEATTIVTDGCRFRKAVRTTGTSPELYDSRFEAIVTMACPNNGLTAHVCSCRFANGVKLVPLEESASVSLNGSRFVGNYFERAGIFVESDESLGSSQTYVYEGNAGAANKASLHLVNPLTDDMNSLIVRDVSNTSGNGKIKVSVPFSYLPSMELFAIGTRKFSICIKGTFFYRGSDSYEAWYSFEARSTCKVEGKRGNFTLVQGEYNVAQSSIVTDFASNAMPNVKDVGDSSVEGKFLVGWPTMSEADYHHTQDWIVEVEDLGNV